MEKKRGKSWERYRETERVKEVGSRGDKRKEKEKRKFRGTEKEFFKIQRRKMRSMPVKQKHKQNSYFGNLHWKFWRIIFSKPFMLHLRKLKSREISQRWSQMILFPFPTFHFTLLIFMLLILLVEYLRVKLKD